MDYHILALHFSRKAICYSNLNYKGAEDFLNKSKQINLLYNDLDFWEGIQTEYYLYT